MYCPRPRLLLAAAVFVALLQWRLGGASWGNGAPPSPIEKAPYPTPVSFTHGSGWCYMLDADLTIVGPGAAGIDSSDRELMQSWVTELQQGHKRCSASSYRIIVSHIEVELRSAATLPWGKDESYEIVHSMRRADVLTVRVNSVNSMLWALHSLEAIFYTSGCNGFPSELQIVDEPRLRYRSLMIDTARNYLPMQHLKKLLRFMSYLKLNVLHWHFEDDLCFSFRLDSFPHADFQPWGYTKVEIREIVELARSLGVRVIPEFNPVSHAASWIVGDPSIVVQCPTWACTGSWSLSSNLISQHTIDVLLTTYGELFELFPDPIVHLGGDEPSIACWLEDPAVRTAIERVIGPVAKYNGSLEKFLRQIGVTDPVRLRIGQMTVEEYLELDNAGLVELGYMPVDAARMRGRAMAAQHLMTSAQRKRLDLFIQELLQPIYKLMRANNKEVMVWHDGWLRERPEAVDGPDYVLLWHRWEETDDLFENVTVPYKGLIYANPWYLDAGCGGFELCYYGTNEPLTYSKYMGATACAWELSAENYHHYKVWMRLAAIAGNFWTSAVIREQEIRSRPDPLNSAATPRFLQMLVWLDSKIHFADTPIRTLADATNATSSSTGGFFYSPDWFRVHGLTSEWMCALSALAYEHIERSAESEAVTQVKHILKAKYAAWYVPGMVEIRERLKSLPWLWQL